MPLDSPAAFLKALGERERQLSRLEQLRGNFPEARHHHDAQIRALRAELNKISGYFEKAFPGDARAYIDSKRADVFVPPAPPRVPRKSAKPNAPLPKTVEPGSPPNSVKPNKPVPETPASPVPPKAVKAPAFPIEQAVPHPLEAEPLEWTRIYRVFSRRRSLVEALTTTGSKFEAALNRLRGHQFDDRLVAHSVAFALEKKDVPLPESGELARKLRPRLHALVSSVYGDNWGAFRRVHLARLKE